MNDLLNDVTDSIILLERVGIKYNKNDFILFREILFLEKEVLNNNIDKLKEIFNRFIKKHYSLIDKKNDVLYDMNLFNQIKNFLKIDNGVLYINHTFLHHHLFHNLIKNKYQKKIRYFNPNLNHTIIY